MTATQENRYPEAEHAVPSGLTADRVARLVTELGAGWARYGLTVGRLALHQSAKVLESTGELLGAVATRIEAAAKKAEEKAAEKKDEVVAEAEPVAKA